VSQLAGITEEDNIVQVVDYLIKFMVQSELAVLTILWHNAQDASYYNVFGKYWKWLTDTLQKYTDIDYDYLYTQLIHEKQLPLAAKQILMRYHNDNEFKIYKNLHFTSALIDIMKNQILVKGGVT
jgi:uncharacterized protein YyaL (SSP411 family)